MWVRRLWPCAPGNIKIVELALSHYMLCTHRVYMCVIPLSFHYWLGKPLVATLNQCLYILVAIISYDTIEACVSVYHTHVHASK